MSFPIAEFFRQFLSSLPAILPRLLLAWTLTFVLVIALVLWLKGRIRPQILHTDARLRAWARTLRYQDVTATGPTARERHARTWFFRFWTNFASAPSLILWSLAVPIWATGQVPNDPVSQARFYYLPGLCYAGSMLLSFVSKRVFKRVRPERTAGAFGHKLKDGSFPSGHSLTSFCFWFMLPIAALLAGTSFIAVGLLCGAAVGIVLLTGLSRIYLGVHFPSDVLGGYSMGFLWCLISYFALRPAL